MSRCYHNTTLLLIHHHNHRYSPFHLHLPSFLRFALPTSKPFAKPPFCLPRSQLSTIATDHPTPPPLPHLPIERLFVPPEVDLSDAVVASRVLAGSNIVLGPYAKGAIVNNSEFVKSSVRKEDCPADGLPEFALVGRSNVGKSSLLNSIVRRKKLALTSKKPGKTQCINHFRIDDSWYLVDLPGYGYDSN